MSVSCMFVAARVHSYIPVYDEYLDSWQLIYKTGQNRDDILLSISAKQVSSRLILWWVDNINQDQFKMNGRTVWAMRHVFSYLQRSEFWLKLMISLLDNFLFCDWYLTNNYVGISHKALDKIGDWLCRYWINTDNKW